MMKFQKTEHLNLSERIEVVSREIKSEYPELSSEDIIKAAAFVDVVPENIDEDIMFDRYYYIMFVINKVDFMLSKRIFDDAKKYCKHYLKKQINIYLFDDLEKHFNGEIASFPIISDYYDE